MSFFLRLAKSLSTSEKDTSSSFDFFLGLPQGFFFTLQAGSLSELSDDKLPDIISKEYTSYYLHNQVDLITIIFSFLHYHQYYAYNHLFIYLFIYSFTCLLAYSFIYSFIKALVHTQPSIKLHIYLLHFKNP